MLTSRIAPERATRPAIRRPPLAVPARELVGVFHLEPPALAPRVAAAFAYERDARAAVELIRSAGIQARFAWRLVRAERTGDVQLVVVDVTLARPAEASRVETLMAGAHGAPVPVDQAPACGVPQI